MLPIFLHPAQQLLHVLDVLVCPFRGSFACVLLHLDLFATNVTDPRVMGRERGKCGSVCFVSGNLLVLLVSACVCLCLLMLRILRLHSRTGCMLLAAEMSGAYSW